MFPIAEQLARRWQHLAAVHAAPRWLWPALVAGLLEDGWTVEDARKNAQKFKGVEAPPEWSWNPVVLLHCRASGLTPSYTTFGGAIACRSSA
jgi:hypothetical protein